MSFRAYLNNMTPFSAEKFVLLDKFGQEVTLVVVSATFSAGRVNSRPVLADEQVPVRFADEYNGTAELASLRYEADIALEKPFVDLLINGHAYAPGGRASCLVPVEVVVADIHKQLVVSGDRYWRRGLNGTRASSPDPFIRMPMVFERAFGGIDRSSPDPGKHAAEPRNLSGVGFRGASSHDSQIQTELPNIEYPHARMTHPSATPEPAGLGVVARGWHPRIRFAGTYDKKWIDLQWPLLPLDFDSRHYQAAAFDQQSRSIRGGETVLLRNLTPDGTWRFDLPILNVPMRLYYADQQEDARLRLDTVRIEPDLRQVTMTCRATIPVRCNSAPLREIVIGHATNGWLRAHRARKQYIDTASNGGKLPSTQPYTL